MKNLRSYFRFSKSQRNGILVLIVLMVFLQGFYFYLKMQPEQVEAEPDKIAEYQREIDSLKLVKLESRFPKLYPFNPNYITDHKGYTLGMSNEEIDRLLKFREANNWINSAAQFQDVTKVSDSLLATLSPYFKFPDWVTNAEEKRTTPRAYSSSRTNAKIDLNRATKEQLVSVNGIGETLSERILEYRSRQELGFIDAVELRQIYGLKEEVINELLTHFFISPPTFEKIDINAATTDELVMIKYIDYEIAHNIIEYRTLHEGFKSLDELTKVKHFPLNKIDIIKLYLRLN